VGGAQDIHLLYPILILLMQKSSVDYISALSNSHSANAKMFWNFLKSFKGCRQSPPPLSVSGNYVSDNKAYFSSVFTSEVYHLFVNL